MQDRINLQRCSGGADVQTVKRRAKQRRQTPRKMAKTYTHSLTHSFTHSLTERERERGGGGGGGKQTKGRGGRIPGVPAGEWTGVAPLTAAVLQTWCARPALSQPRGKSPTKAERGTFLLCPITLGLGSHCAVVCHAVCPMA